MAKATITIEDTDTEPGKVKLRVAFSPAINPLSQHDTTPALDLAFALLSRANELRTQHATEPQQGTGDKPDA